jgi:hypothetical protein
MTAAQILAKCDALFDAANAMPVEHATPRLVEAAEAYRAARASSPRTLEETAIPAWATPELVKKLIQAATIWADEHSISPNALSVNEQDWRSRVLDLSYRLRDMKYEHERNARRLAGEGGA